MIEGSISSDACAIRLVEVLIVDKDKSLRTTIAAAVQRSFGWAVHFASDVTAAKKILAKPVSPQVVISGLALRQEQGSELIGAVELIGDRVVIFLDKMLYEDDGADAFLAGADDVIRTPFSMRELTARLCMRLGKISDVLDVPVSMQPESSCGLNVIFDDVNILANSDLSLKMPLTRSEAEIMQELVACAGEIVTRDQLSRRIDNCEWVYGDRKFDVHITKIRKKLRTVFGKQYIVKSIRSVGYALCENTEVTQEPCLVS